MIENSITQENKCKILIDIEKLHRICCSANLFSLKKFEFDLFGYEIQNEKKIIAEYF